MFVHKTPTNPSCDTVKNLLLLKNSFNIDRFLIFVWLGRGTQHNDTWHNNKKPTMTFSIMTLNTVMLSVVYPECRNKPILLNVV